MSETRKPREWDLRFYASSLRYRLEILDTLRAQLADELERAERGGRLLMRADEDYQVRVASESAEAPHRLRSALALNETATKARKHLRAAIDLLSCGDFGWGLKKALGELVTMTALDSPRTRRDEILLAADEAGIDRDAILETAKRAGVPVASRAALKVALSSARKKKAQTGEP